VGQTGFLTGNEHTTEAR